MNILISTNSSYMHIISIMLFSLCKSHPTERIELYLAYSDMSENSLDAIKLILNQFENKVFHPLKIDEQLANRIKPAGRFSKEAYYRIFALNMLPSDMDRILYLDGDMIVKGSLIDVYHSELTIDCPFLVCEDIDGTIRDNNWYLHERTGVPNNYKCFNSGFMLINLQYMRHHHNLEYIKEAFLREGNNYPFPDQDILNHMFYDRVKYVPWQLYNLPAEWWFLDMDKLVYDTISYVSYPQMFSESIDKEIRFVDITAKMKANARVVHFFGLLKPWIYTAENMYDDVKFYCDLWFSAEEEMYNQLPELRQLIHK